LSNYSIKCRRAKPVKLCDVLSRGLQVQPAPVIARAASTARTRYRAGCEYSLNP
jgi:hypothetical protein